MTEYIKRENAKRAVWGCARDTGIDEAPFEYAEGLLGDVPSEDVAPVRRGHWDFYDGKWYCSVCGYCMEWCLSKPIEDWCGSCGARMDGENDEID